MSGLKATLSLSVVVLVVGCRARSLPHEGKSVAQLERMLRDPSARVQAQGALGLSLKGPEALPAVPALIGLLDSPDALVRQHAALALGKIGPAAKAALPELKAALKDDDERVRQAAQDALEEVGRKK